MSHVSYLSRVLILAVIAIGLCVSLPAIAQQAPDSATFTSNFTLRLIVGPLGPQMIPLGYFGFFAVRDGVLTVGALFSRNSYSEEPLEFTSSAMPLLFYSWAAGTSLGVTSIVRQILPISASGEVTSVVFGGGIGGIAAIEFVKPNLANLNSVSATNIVSIGSALGAALLADLKLRSSIPEPAKFVTDVLTTSWISIGVGIVGILYESKRILEHRDHSPQLMPYAVTTSLGAAIGSTMILKGIEPKRDWLTPYLKIQAGSIIGAVIGSEIVKWLFNKETPELPRPETILMVPAMASIGAVIIFHILK